jgi:hypothetical protein
VPEILWGLKAADSSPNSASSPTPGVGESLTLRPAAKAWADLAIAHHESLRASPAAFDRSQSIRSALGLPTDGIVIMSGHQAEWWHPGILAKWLAMEATVRVLRDRGHEARAAWVVVEQDSNEPWSVRVPSMLSDGTAAQKVDWPLQETGGTKLIPAADTPTGCLPPLIGASLNNEGWSGKGPTSVSGGLELMRASLKAFEGEASLARQLGLATRHALRHLGLIDPKLPEAILVQSGTLTATDLFVEVAGRLGSEANAAVRAYNAAVLAEPGAKLRPLDISDKGRIELPLWRVRPRAPRARVYADDLRSIPAAQLAPRALLMTALLRQGACDLFIHGLGGEVYERANQRWAGAWLAPGTTLTPIAVASSTRFIPGLAGPTPPPLPEEIARHVWAARHARHAPDAAKDPEAAAERAALVNAIRTARRDGRDPKIAFDALHAFLNRYREQQKERLSSLAAEAVHAQARRNESAVVYARDWAFPLYPPEVLTALRDQVRAAMLPPGDTIGHA